MHRYTRMKDKIKKLHVITIKYATC